MLRAEESAFRAGTRNPVSSLVPRPAARDAGRMPGRKTPLPLALLLYETQNEYVTQSQRAGSLPEIARGWMAGHYSPSERLSRMFVPERDARSEALLETYAHELTHHWLDTRAPFDVPRRTSDARRLPGFWVVEGFATMLEEFRLDPQFGYQSHKSTNRHVASPFGQLCSAGSECFQPLAGMRLQHGQVGIRHR